MVSNTETPPIASGSTAAAKDPKIASRISATTGKPTRSAPLRSSLVRSTIPAHSAPAPTRCSFTAPYWRPSLSASFLRSTLATSGAWNSSALSLSGMTTGRPGRVRARYSPVSASCGTRSTRGVSRAALRSAAIAAR